MPYFYGIWGPIKYSGGGELLGLGLDSALHKDHILTLSQRYCGTGPLSQQPQQCQPSLQGCLLQKQTLLPSSGGQSSLGCWCPQTGPSELWNLLKVTLANVTRVINQEDNIHLLIWTLCREIRKNQRYMCGSQPSPKAQKASLLHTVRGLLLA